jgi:hypothetical protein
MKGEGGAFAPVSWAQGEKLLVRHIERIRKKGRGERVVFMTELSNGTLKDLMSHWLSENGLNQEPVLYEPYAYEPLREANRIVFGYDGIPHYRIDKADFLISFGAGFLETCSPTWSMPGSSAYFIPQKKAGAILSYLWVQGFPSRQTMRTCG